MTGLFGGSFNPPHLGHRALLDAARKRFALDRIVVLVAASPLYKVVAEPVDARLELARAAFPDCEIEREESTSDVTVREAERRFGEVIFLIGADQFAAFPTWHDPAAVLEHARLGVATRSGFPQKRLDAVLAQLDRPDRVDFFAIPELPIASSDIRARVAAGEPVDQLVPSRVAAAIRELELYRGQ